MMLQMERHANGPDRMGPPGGPQPHGEANEAPPRFPDVAVAVVALAAPGSVIVTRPLKELFFHVKYLTLPSFQLIVRAIVTLVAGLFRGHLCDNVMLIGEKGEGRKIHHSLNGRVVSANQKELEKQFPFMLESAYLLTYKNGTYRNRSQASDSKSASEKVEYSYEEREAEHGLFIRSPDHSQLKEVTPQTICEYYHKFHQIQITDKLKNNTISDLFRSKCFKLANMRG